MPPDRVRRFRSSDPGFEAAFTALSENAREGAAEVDAVAAEIVAEVQRDGDKALLSLTERLDRHSLTADQLAVTPGEVDDAIARCDPSVLAALQTAAERIRIYHARQMPEDVQWTDEAGVRLGWRWTPLAAVGLYVPGGTASYPSSVLMNAIPAKVAQVERLVMVVPMPGGVVNPLVLAAARIAGVDEIYRIGGAQAVAALAYGTETIRPVDKIVGPGNAYVAAAKRLVFGRVGIDTIAGPSEILVVSDAKNDPAWIAADLLSQAEHDTLSQAVLITDDADFADRVEQAIEDHLQHLPRQAIARESWTRFGAIILVDNLTAEAPALVDRLASEHVELAIDEPDAMASRIRHAGALFLGRQTPEAVGDYVGGPNHVLPTSRAARFSSGLSVADFIKRTSLLSCDAASLRRIGPAAEILARAEGLDAHALSIAIRLGSNE
jgi:histidinol dehydrogenase